jgi:hypothetical protein
MNETTQGRPIVRCRFTDGVERDVCEDDQGRQYVLDDDNAGVRDVAAAGG